MNKIFPDLKKRSPWVFSIEIAVSVFFAETFIMLIFLVLPKLPNLVETFIDSTLLAVLITPALYFFGYRPLLLEISTRSQIERELRNSQFILSQQTQQLEETLKKLQQAPQLLHSEKISSLGQLVAGVAHEINNPVNFISGNFIHVQEYCTQILSLVQLYQSHYPEPVPEIQARLDEIEIEFLQSDLTKILNSMKIGVDRIGQIVRSLRNFSRIDRTTFKLINLHEEIDSTLIILQHRLKATPEHPAIELIKEYGELPEVECFIGQLNQVFMNIITNAIDALEEVNVKRKYKEISENPSRITIRTSVLDSGWVEIAIADNGPGISEQVQHQIFQPFFTTKPVDKGTGLGLSISYQIIVEKHGGHLNCLSHIGKGTEFIIQIPIRQQV